MAHRQFALVDSAVDVTAPLFCQRPLERALRKVERGSLYVDHDERTGLHLTAPSMPRMK